ncbi:TonB-dependent receptor [Pandoraea faecigallinarum]|uniref:TonB-dependent receptor n=2 Tax=Pandoraea faecigallinarum TaxID=656179 RepID=A0A0H3WXE5_9BURK|nr:TonB-dependent receptor [Pandoraea faecigallinarum]
MALAAAGVADRANAASPGAAPATKAAPASSAPRASPVTSDARRAWRIAPGTLDAVLNRFASAAGIELTVDASLTQGRQSAGLDGDYTLPQALDQLLSPHRLQAMRSNQGVYTLRAATHDAANVSAGDAVVLPTTHVVAQAVGLPEAYEGGQVARGGRLGLLGNKDLMDVPFNIASYTARTIQDQQSTTLADVLDNDPSVRFTTSSGHMYENFSVRGFPLTADEVSLNGMFGLSPYGHVPTEFIERVEVLKGPNALLNGMSPSGAVGGAINVVTKKAESTPLARVTADYLSDAQFGVQADLGRRFGDDEQIGIRFNGALRDGRTTLEGQNKRRQFGAVALDLKTDRVRIGLDAYTDTEKYTGGSPWMATFATKVVPPPAAGTNVLRGEFGDLESTGAQLRGEVDITDAITAYAGIGALSYRYAGFITGTRTGPIKPDGSYTGATYYQRGWTDTLSLDAGVRTRFRTGALKHELTLSATSLDTTSGNVFTTSSNYTSNIYAPVDPTLAQDPGAAPKTADTTLSSFALADTISMWHDRVTLIAGVRSQRVRAAAFSASTGARTSNYDENAITPAFGLVLKPFGPNVSLYGNYIEGLTQGGMVTDVSAANYGQIFAPYRSKQAEFGVKWDAGSFTNTLAFFQITKPGMIKDTATNTYNPDGEQRNRGVEWNVFGEFTPRWRVLGGVAYTRGELTKTAGNLYNGNTPYGVPKWTANLGTEWDLPWVPGMTLTGRMITTSSQYVNSANTQKIGGWTRYDVGARYATRLYGKGVVFRAAVENVTNRIAWSGTFNDGYVIQNAPRTFKLSASIDF